ncbi:MAG TPA: hypothetical protein VKP60_19225 [Magnetospirillaceae bacterium]|nr:hypothetical protein [Magnetospirillaceae bacterium]
MEKTAKTEFSKSQLDRLGERLRSDLLSAEDLRLLDDYRRSFSEGYEHVVKIIRDELELEPTGRPAKSTTSIRDKLKRESIRLSQMQDIAGCRIVVPDLMAQDAAIKSLISKLGDLKIFDRRLKPSNGYRAVHLIAYCSDRYVEIQVRSALQHMWAELSEKFADIIDPALKYGKGPDLWQETLLRASQTIGTEERTHSRLRELKSKASSLPNLPPNLVEDIRRVDAEIAAGTVQLRGMLEQVIADISKYEGR